MRERSMVLTDGRLTIRADSAVGVGSTLTTVDGWVEPDVRTDLVERLGHGSMVARSEWDAREVLVGGHIDGLSPAEVPVWLRVLSAIAAPDTPAVLTVDDQGLVLSAEVVRNGRPRQAHSLEHGWIEWELPLVAPDPHLYGPVRETHIPMVGAGVGLEYLLFSVDGMLTYGDAVAADTVLRNDGNAAAFPTYLVTGDLPSGFRLVQGGAVDEYVGAVWPDAPAVVDMGAGRVLVGGVDRSHELGRAEWAGIDLGGSVVPEFSADQGSGFVVATVRDTWI